MTTKNEGAALNVYQRLAKVMEEVTYIQKERKQGMNYTIVSHDAVTAKVRPSLLKHGVVYHPVRCEHTHNGNRAECSMTVRFVNVNNPSDYFDVPSFGYGIDTQDKGPGKAMSYAVKYALLKALGLETGDDPDNDSIPHEPEETKPEPAPKPASKAASRDVYDRLSKANRALATEAEFNKFWATESVQKAAKSLPPDWAKSLKEEKDDKAAELAERPAMQGDDLSGFVPPDFDSLQSEHHGDRE